MFFISLFAIISVVALHPKIFLWIYASYAEVVAVKPRGISTFLANGVSSFFINPTFINSPGSLPRNPPDSIILESLVFASTGNLSIYQW